VIRYWSYLDYYGARREELLRRLDEVLSSGRLIFGAEGERFEKAFAAHCGAGWGIGVNSGTDALFLAFKALGLGPGDEAVTVANTAVPTVAAIRATGATPVFVDVEEETYLMDVGRVEERLSTRTRLLVPVHLCGQAVDMGALTSLAAARGLAVVEDCAQACGATFEGRRVGSLGDVGAFSFYPTKILGACGDAGMAVTSSEELAAKLRRLRFYGMDREYYAEEEGYNSRLDEVQAALLNLRLGELDEAVARRRRIARLYDEALAGVGDVGLPAVRPGGDHQYYVYTIRTSRRDDLARHLGERGIGTKVNYPVPVHLMRGYAFLGGRVGDLPVTERLAGTILSLPLYPEMPLDDAASVADAVRAFFGAG
jgi:dTDP-4-amino-4,6-dideoxygalactose transaminase